MDPDRLLVLESNVILPGEILFKPRTLGWDEAAEDHGSGTWLSPQALLESTRAHEEPEEEEFQLDLGVGD